MLSDTSIVYSFGIGQNASFEEDIIAEFNCKVYGFDPTKKSVDWAGRQQFGPRFQFFGIGLSDIDGQENFFPPADPNDISYSSQPAEEQKQDPVTLEVLTLSSVMARMDHAKLDVLKMDIEGSESKVIKNILSTSVRPAQLLIEFHHGFYGNSRTSTMRAVDDIKSMGYKIFWVSDRGLEYGFVHSTVLA